MAIVLRPVCQCDLCGHEWTKKGATLALQCPQCHTRKWNGDKDQRQGSEKLREQISEDW